ncbi:energy transducer TonB family protein [Helicobacter cetorum]|uniref:Siderophore-mediated iron transport protein n=1 Tax=Helicobacter cetorum (strain ATCC BAA-429 / MIT 00-7128) TaxID=182217 RepID=I0EKK0_HELC0|nr:energy transducer TonB [Helicobacter cetorum]AFI03469.1 siderophore-mediated iron transport protein [Helicobacter cetorum MIT 00-7128]
MKTSLSPHKLSKISTLTGFAITFVLYAGGLVYFLLREDAPMSLAQAGTTKVTMSLASINTNSNVKTNAESAKPKEAELKKEEEPKKDKPKPKPKPKPTPKPKPKPKPTPKPKPKEELKPKPEPKPKDEPKKEDKKEEAPKKDEPKKEEKEEATKKATTKDLTKDKKKDEESNKTSEGATSEAQAYNPGVNDEFLMKIQMAISSKNRYPRTAQMRGIEGEVLVSFIVNVDGSVTDIKVVKSNTSEILNHAALEAVKSAASLFPKPEETVHLKIPIAYTLKEDS